MLLDLENMRVAAPLLDFGKLVDLGGLADSAHRAAFFRGYERYSAPAWPWPAALRAVRLWTVVTLTHSPRVDPGDRAPALTRPAR